MSDPWQQILADEALDDAERDPRIGPSDARVLVPGRGCARHLAYRVQEVEPTDETPERVRRAAVIGKAIHDRVSEARQAAGWWVRAVLRVPGFDRDGEADAVHLPDGIVDDLKTKSARGFGQVVDQGHAHPEDFLQVELYGLALEDKGDPPSVLSVTYISREDGATHTYTRPYNRTEALHTATRMHAIIDLTESTPPENIPRGGKAPGGRPCDSCRWRSTCWGITEETPAETAVSALAGPAEVQQAARDHRALSAQIGELAEAWDFCVEVLRGHAGARFTDTDGTVRTVAWSRGREPGHGGRLDTRAARELLEQHDITPPTLGVSPRLSFPAVKPTNTKETP